MRQKARYALVWHDLCLCPEHSTRLRGPFREAGAVSWRGAGKRFCSSRKLQPDSGLRQGSFKQQALLVHPDCQQHFVRLKCT